MGILNDFKEFNMLKWATCSALLTTKCNVLDKIDIEITMQYNIVIMLKFILKDKGALNNFFDHFSFPWQRDNVFGKVFYTPGKA